MGKRKIGKLAQKLAASTKAAPSIGSKVLRETAAKTKSKAANSADLSHLAQLCRQAADHLAQAHKSLFVEPEGPDMAIAHLDAALACLKHVAAHSGTSRVQGQRAVGA